MRIKDIKIPLYRDSITIMVGKKQEAQSYFDKKKLFVDLNSFYDCAAATIHPTGEAPIIWCKDTNRVSELGHEIIHASMSILRRAGVKVDTDNHEALTYLFTYIFDEIFKK